MKKSIIIVTGIVGIAAITLGASLYISRSTEVEVSTWGESGIGVGVSESVQRTVDGASLQGGAW